MEIRYCYGCMERITTYPCQKCGYSPTYSAASYMLQPGTILNGKYLIGKALGQGGFGITYIGMDLQLQRKVAIKEYYPSGFVGRHNGNNNLIWYTGDAAQEARNSGQNAFLKEARKMSKVSDIDSVVKVFNIFHENGTSYICMDFIEGHTLQQHLRKTGTLSWEQTKSIFFPVIETMDRVHQLGLIHRDISPDNLMLQPDGKIKILDLGAAKDLNLNSGKSSMQVAKNGFSPLEQYIQAGNSGSWTDVYAMAASMYYTLTGVLPPSAIDRIDNDTLQWDLPPLQVLPSEVRRALQHALNVRSGERTQTMAEFLQELQSKTTPRKKLLIPALAGLVALIALIAGISFAGRESENPQEPRPAASTHHQPVTISDDLLQKQIEELMDSCSMEVYNYRNGARMELYFNDDGKECLRIFTNEEGKDEFTFLAEYDTDGNILKKYGITNQELTRYTTWKRNQDGKATEILEYKENGILMESTEIDYDSQGREISRTAVDGEGHFTLQATSTYDAAGRETYTGTNNDGEHFVSLYNADGNLLESTTTDENGNHVSRTAYTYDEDGKRTEYVSYDENDNVTYRSKYHYKGELQVGYTSYSYTNDTEYVYEYEYIFGPRDIQFGQSYSYDDTSTDTESVQDMDTDWILRQYAHYTNSYSDYQVTNYNWSWDSLGYESFDEDGNLIMKSTTLFDESGNKTGSENYRYNDDGSYSITLYNADFVTQRRDDYSFSNKLLSSTEYHYNSNGEQSGSVKTEYNDDGSYIETEMDASYRTIASHTYDSSGMLVGAVEYSYNSDGTRAGSVSTVYYYDGSYTITETKGYSDIISQKNYDANGNLIRS